MKKLVVAVSLLGFLLYRPYVMQSSSLMYGGDDYNYMAHATSIAYGQFPDYTHEANLTFPPFHAMGCSILVVPFVFVGSLVDRILGSDVISSRTHKTLHGSYTTFGFVLGTLTFLTLGICWLHGAASILFGQRHATVAIVLNVLPSGLLLYAYRRPIFPHVHEFALVALLLFLLMKYLKSDIGPELGAITVAAVLAGALCITRLNDTLLATAFLACFIHLFWVRYKSEGRPGLWERLRVLSLATLVFVSITSLTFWARAHSVDGKSDVIRISPSFYTDFASHRFGTYRGVDFYVETALHFLFGLDWGILFSAPLLLVGLVGLMYAPVRPYMLTGASALAVNFYVAIVFGSQGGYYGYRYVVYCALPLSTVGLACLLSRYWYSNRSALILAIVSIVPLASMLAFEGNPTELTLHVGDTQWVKDWINNSYQLEVWRLSLTNPEQMAVVALKGGPLYLVYLTAVAFERLQDLPEIVRLKYPLFSVPVLLKTVVIWLWPATVLAGYDWIGKALHRHRSRP